MPQATSQLNYQVTAIQSGPSSPMTGATLAASHANPMFGTTVTLTAGGSGGTAPYAFKLWVQRDGGAWVMLRDWSTSATVNWTPSATGTYVFGLWARSAGNSADLPETIATRTLTVTP